MLLIQESNKALCAGLLAEDSEEQEKGTQMAVLVFTSRQISPRSACIIHVQSRHLIQHHCSSPPFLEP